MRITLDTRGLDKYRQDLNKLSRSAFPISVRKTLDEAAFDMKKNELHKAAKEKFEYTRSKHFFKRFSYVNKATGFDIGRMQAKIGLRDLGQRSAKAAVENMNLHQTGGQISKGGAYLKDARISSNFGRLALRKNYYKKSNILNNKNNITALKKSNFVLKAMLSQKENKPFWHQTKKGNFLFSIKSIRSTKKGKKIKTRILMRERKISRIKANKFVTLGAKRTEKKIPKLYQIEFNKQFNKYVGRKK